MVLMLAITGLMLGAAVTAPLLGSLMDRISMRALTALGATLMVSGYLALSFATSFNQILLIYAVLLGPTQVLIGPVAVTVLLSRWFVMRRGRAIGIAIVGLSVGSFLFAPVVQALLDNFDWRTAVRIYAVILAVCAAPALLMIVNRPSDKGLHADGAPAPPPDLAKGKAPPVASTRLILTDPAFWLTGAVFAVATSGMLGMIVNLVPLAVDEGVDPTSAAWLISGAAACGLVSRLVFATIADRVGPRLLMFGSLLGFALGMACMALADAGFAMIVAGVALISLFGGVMPPLQTLLVPRIFGDHVAGRAGGLLQTLTLLALLSSPPIFGLIFDLTGSYTVIFAIFAGAGAAAMLIVPRIRMHPRETATPDSESAGAATPAREAG